MAYLSEKTSVLTADQAAHLLRRATVGPTKDEIVAFTGLTPAAAYQKLLFNNIYNPAPPIILDENSPRYKQEFVNAPFLGDENFQRSSYIKYWWQAQLLRFGPPTTTPNLLEKLSVFWQNHFVTTREIVSDNKFVWKYLSVIRGNALGNFRTFVKAITKDPAMLVYLNGNENVKGSANENYARELQELFMVGEKDFYGNLNYTEDDVKAAARVLTGWRYANYNYWKEGYTTVASEFVLNNHDTDNKVFSNKYGANGTTITGINAPNGGDLELDALINMLLLHPETPKFICRKLYKWYVNPMVTETIENNVIIPLANFFKSPANNYEIEPVLKKLMLSDEFFEPVNIGAIIKSPLELVSGSLRHFGLQVPDMQTDTIAYRKYFEYLDWKMFTMQMSLIDQPSVFGWEPFYQTALSRAWIASSSIALRYDYTDQYIWGWLQVSPIYNLGIQPLDRAIALQPNFLTLFPTPPSNILTEDHITTEQILASFTDKLFVNPLFQAQKDFLIDTIMMNGLPRTSWLFEWRAFRNDSKKVADGTIPATNQGYIDKRNGVRWRLQLLYRYLLRMAEYQVF
jgi:uncharacterized protein (DUF1800 family)